MTRAVGVSARKARVAVPESVRVACRALRADGHFRAMRLIGVGESTLMDLVGANGVVTADVLARVQARLAEVDT